MRLLIVIVITLLMSPIVFSKTKLLPANTGKAKVRFYSPQEIRAMSTLVRFTAFKGDRCFGHKELLYLGSHGARNRKLADIDLGMLKDPGKSYSNRHYFEITVPAGTKFVFAAEGVRILERCRPRTSFVPLENMEYEITYTSDATSCRIDIDRIQMQEGKFMRDTETSRVVHEPDCTKW